MIRQTSINRRECDHILIDVRHDSNVIDVRIVLWIQTVTVSRTKQRCAQEFPVRKIEIICKAIKESIVHQ